MEITENKKINLDGFKKTAALCIHGFGQTAEPIFCAFPP
jgi:hypothetical protein